MQIKETSCFDVSTEQLLMNLFIYPYTLYLLMFILMAKKSTNSDILLITVL